MSQILDKLIKQEKSNNLKLLWNLVLNNVDKCFKTNEYNYTICMWIKYLYDNELIVEQEKQILYNDLQLISQYSYKQFPKINLNPDISSFLYDRFNIENRIEFIEWRINLLDNNLIYPKDIKLKCHYNKHNGNLNTECKSKVVCNINYTTYENNKSNLNCCKNHIDYIRNWSNHLRDKYGFNTNLKIIYF